MNIFILRFFRTKYYSRHPSRGFKKSKFFSYNLQVSFEPSISNSVAACHLLNYPHLFSNPSTVPRSIKSKWGRDQRGNLTGFPGREVRLSEGKKKTFQNEISVLWELLKINFHFISPPRALQSVLNCRNKSNRSIISVLISTPTKFIFIFQQKKPPTTFRMRTARVCPDAKAAFSTWNSGSE